MVKKFLEVLNHRADVAESGEEALRLISASRYDLVITDIGMPNMNGWHLIERIKADHPDMKIAVVTGWGSDMPDDGCKGCNVDFFIDKPIQLEQLKRLIELLTRPA